MVSKIPYKTLKSDLKFLFSSEMTEVISSETQKSVKTRYVHILPDKHSVWSGNQLIKISKEDLPFLNAVSSGNAADRFVEDIAKALGELTLKINSKGQPFALEQQKVLWQDWLKLRENLSANYTGDWVERMLMQADKKLLPSEKLFFTVMEDLFLSEFFNAAHFAEFSSGIFTTTRIIQALLPFKITFKEDWTLEELDDSFRIHFKGYLKEVDEQALKLWLTEAKLPEFKDEKIEITSSGFLDINKKTCWCSGFDTFYMFSVEDLYQRTMNNKLMSA